MLLRPFGAPPSSEISSLTVEYPSLLTLNQHPQSAEEEHARLKKNTHDEFSALNALIHARGARWSQKARAIKFDIEFKATEQERRRVAKELHDEILPSLARLIRSIQTPGGQRPPDPLVDELHATVAAFRDLLGELHAVDLEELGLVAALGNICKRYSRMTDRCVLFFEHSEECSLTDIQQLCIYRAMQTALKMFAESENDILLVNYYYICGKSVVTLRCVDKSVASARWLSTENSDFDAFQSWCAVAGAELQSDSSFNNTRQDLIFTVSENQPAHEDVLALIGQLSQARLHELDTIVAFAQDEWAGMLNRDCSLFKDLAIEMERRRICDQINQIILPHLSKIVHFAEESNDARVRAQVIQQMRSIVAGVNGVMSESLPRFLSETGLVSSTKMLVQRFKRATLIETTFISTVSCELIELSVAAKLAIYRVIQEALNNVEKHSEASRTHVTINIVSGVLAISIDDNGKGFHENKCTQSRGLRNIRERVSAIGASVCWERSHSFSTGTLVRISLPCSHSEVETIINV